MCDIWMDVDAALAEVPVNKLPILDDTDYKSREVSVAYNAAGMDLVWNFMTSAGAFTQTAVTPSNSGDYLWTNQGKGHYTIQIPASGGATINNDTEGFGFFSGFATGFLPWIGPIVGFRASGLNDKLIDSAYDTTRGLAGTALPAAAAEAAGGLYTRGTGAGQINQNANGQADARAVATGSNAINAAGLDPDVTTELQNGLATAANLATVAGYLDTEIAAILSDTNELQTDWANGGRLDLLIDAIKAKTDLVPAAPAAVGDVPTAAENAAALMDLSNGIETSITPRQALRLILAASAGKLSGAATTTIVVRNVGDSKDRITATVDSSGNRSAVTVDAT